MSPVWHTILPRYRNEFGYMQNLYNGGVSAAIEQGLPWMLDNGVFTKQFEKDKWIGLLEKLMPYQDMCIAVVVPDYVGNCKFTLQRFKQYADIPKQMGYRTALVSQDGMAVGVVPWNQFDCIFIGGTDEHKLTEEAMALIRYAQTLGKWIHIGRVNSAERISRFWFADSWDGTTLSKEPSIPNQRKILYAAREAKNRQKQRRLL